ncbi:MAG TPA: VOC family protein [Candidatus Saccharimonadia bacterium]|jgi:PhnB protein
MSDLKLNPYIARDGDAREMMEYYHQIFGGELTKQTFGESPMPVPDSHKDQLLHSALVAGRVEIMASDTPPDMKRTSEHNSISLSLSGKAGDEAELKRIFDQFADGGKITMPLEKQFWGDLFGMVDDKFGNHWMVNIEGAKDAGKD